MSHYPNQPQQPFQPHPQPRPPKKSRKGLIVLGVIVAVFVIGGIASTAGGGGDGDGDGDAKSEPGKGIKAEPADKSEKPEPKAAPKKKEGTPKVTFKVWGTGTNGADVTYGSDTDTRKGRLPMTKTLPLSDDAMYYAVNAQLQGGGDLHCSVTVDGKTKKAHASGGYNICNAQLSNTGLSWS